MLGLSGTFMVAMRLPGATRDTGLLELGLALHAMAKSEFLSVASDILNSRYCSATAAGILQMARSLSDGVSGAEQQHWSFLMLATKLRLLFFETLLYSPSNQPAGRSVCLPTAAKTGRQKLLRGQISE